MVEAAAKGEAPDPEDGIKAKQRSVHNTYFTLPVLFVMTSNHYAMTYGHEYNWVILIAIALAGALTGRDAPASLSECRRLVGTWSNSCVLVFPSQISCTAIEHVAGLDRRRSGPGELAGDERCPIRTRSPPGASSRSHH